ncbi:DUF412 domain-containing protein [Budviciaceae bacterium BWR-B9]|uniref:UPF0208 membrane protein EKN56_06105 n=2 Tax=Limnobaculum TaxID=2172100 RepID=A0A411WIJ5_9GAMM|nr:MULTISPECIES: terminus macrodomain insulation protein YfbV [Limnobaculum]MBK5145349.1 DUF412 domain-containing protein [Limnobaculum allomyrinae]MBV7693223.1 DUF412 domain-containing protein [Limnobaculum sp. M2-1]QBH96008.1 DUF412 domain-containing protein [Limnobaculum zhutongyuii]TQS89281.1 DUF412 domain-containing protein [Limnobaculum zhutongyuii]
MLRSSGPIRWIQIFQRGQTYMKTWPNEKRLSAVFPENRITTATRFGVRFMPPVAIFTLAWQIAMSGQLGPAVATAIFACSLPMQGLWWLGQRSISILPPSLKQWFLQLREKLAEAGQEFAPLEQEPTYQHLAELLKHAFNQLDKTFLDEL